MLRESIVHPEPEDPGPDPGPVVETERLESLDLLRGLGILGILVMNIYAFSMPFAAYFNPFQMGGDETWNLGTWVVTHIFFEQKFVTIFAMLFGAGIVLMMQRAEERGVSFGPIFFRRQSLLLVIGLFHMVLLWMGDILSYYALISMLVFFLRHLPPRRLIVIACIMLPVPLLMNYGFSFYMQSLMQQAAELEAVVASGGEVGEAEQEVLDSWRSTRSLLAPTPGDIQADLDAHLGNYVDAVNYRVEHNLPMLFQAIPFFLFWRIGGVMLLGMALMKLGILSGDRPCRFYRRLAIIGYGAGLPLAAASAWILFANGFEPIFVLRWGNLPNYIASILVALGHISIALFILKSGVMPALVARFRAVGRMALTNYLAHSAVMTSIFYGYGLGLYGEVPRAMQMLFVLGLITLQLLYSPWWLSRYRFGPVEWLWRSMTYGRRQPFMAAGK